MSEGGGPAAEAAGPGPGHRARRGLSRRTAWLAALAAAVAVVGTAAWAWSAGSGHAPAGAVAPSATPPAPPLLRPPGSPSAVEIARLPEASYDRVVDGLIPVTTAAVTTVRIGSLTSAAPLYRTDGAKPVARMQVAGPFGEPNPIVVIATAGEWDLVLTPARQALPSSSPSGWAAAQTAGWMPARYIRGLAPASARVTVHLRSHTVVVSRSGAADQTFAVAVGTEATPTPRGVTGYLEARFVNPGGGTESTRVQLTSLHTTGQDNPAGGLSGGLVALHWWPTSTGAGSHGCVRLSRQALTAIDALPLGTPIVTTD